MVKRQTVWLSTMMVLSLMLIGYYTMNNDNGIGTSSSGSSDTTSVVSPTTDNPGSAQTGDTKQTQSNGNSSTTGSTIATNSTDWYIDEQTKLDQQMAEKMDALNAVLANNNATSDQISQAQQQLRQLQTLQGELQNARDQVIGKGYKDCVIMPLGDYSKVAVYVKTDKLTPEQAVQIMHIVSEQLNISAANVSVQIKS